MENRILKKSMNWLIFDKYVRESSTRLLSKGLCTMIAISWYAFNITKDFFDPFFPGTK